MIMMDAGKMSGEEFMNWIHTVQKIEKLEWIVQGETLDADEVSVVVTADGEQLSIPFGQPKWVKYPTWFQKVLIGLIANKIIGAYEFNIGHDPVYVVNAARKALADAEENLTKLDL